LVDPTRPPPSRAPHPPAASGCVRGVPCRSTHSIFAWNRIFHPNIIRPPHPSIGAIGWPILGGGSTDFDETSRKVHKLRGLSGGLFKKGWACRSLQSPL
jgi:hypothetical protein